MRAPLALVAALAACRAGPAPAKQAPGQEVAADPLLSMEDLRSDLEATVLEGYSQLTLGNVDAYVDLLADDVPLIIVRVGPRQVWVGEGPDKARYLRIDPCASVYSKNLEVHLSADGSVGWTFDEVSCRVPDPFEGRLASIPLRVTSVYQRAADRWALVMEHVSYALPVEDISTAARAERLAAPAPVPEEGRSAPDAARRVRNLIVKLVADIRTYRKTYVATDAAALVLLPAPESEVHGADVADAPAIEDLFGEGASASVQTMRVQIARDRRVAWAAGTLRVDASVGGDPVSVGLRATYVFELREAGWTQVQAHVSAPITQGDLTRRVFGIELPQLDELPVP